MTILHSTAKEMEGSANGNFLERVLFLFCFVYNRNFHNKSADSKLTTTQIKVKEALMAREKELFRDNLERLDKQFPGQELLNVAAVSRYCGLSEERTKQMFEFKKVGGRWYISKAKLASALS